LKLEQECVLKLFENMWGKTDISKLPPLMFYFVASVFSELSTVKSQMKFLVWAGVSQAFTNTSVYLSVVKTLESCSYF